MVFYKKILMTLALFLFLPLLPAQADDLPLIRVGYIHTTNHTPLMVAMNLGEQFTADGYSLKPIIPKEKYELLKEGKPLAMLDILVIKSGSETATLFAQKQLDMGLASITAVIAGIDKEAPMKIVAPLVLASGGLVVDKDFPASSWDEFIQYCKDQKEPLAVGYHSPSSAPVIILEAALKEEGLVVSKNPLDLQAQVTLVDLKGTANLLPALSSGQVKAVVGPEPFPQLGLTRLAARELIKLKDMPPAGKWAEYPCCVVIASDDMIATKKELVQDFVNFMSASNTWCNENNKEASRIGCEWVGLSKEVAELSNLRFLPKFTDSWRAGAAGYLDELNMANYLQGVLKGKKFSDVEHLLIDPQFSK